MYAALLNHPERARFDTSTLRVCVSGGAAMPVEVMRSFEQAFGCAILEGYGLSETSPVASFNHPDRERKPGSIGTPVDGVEMKLVGRTARSSQGEVGEIAIRGHNVMKGYWRRPDATAEAIQDGWFHTGDLARVDEDGYFFIVDRKKDMVIRGGYNVYPREIEEVLYEHPAVREAAVIGVPHPELGEEVAAAVVLAPGAACGRARDRRLRQGPGGRVQVPAARLVRGRAAQGLHRQDPQARDRGTRPRDRRGACDRGRNTGTARRRPARARPRRRRSRCCSRTPPWAAGRGCSSRAPQERHRRARAAPGRGGPPGRRASPAISRASRRALRARGRQGRPALRRPRLAGELAPAPASAGLPRRRRHGRRADLRRGRGLADRAAGPLRRRQRPRRAGAEQLPADEPRGPEGDRRPRRRQPGRRRPPAGRRTCRDRRACRRASTRPSSRSAATSPARRARWCCEPTSSS